MVLFWVALLAVSMMIYLLLDGFDLGVGMLFGLAGSEADRDTMLDTVAPVWDGNETWLVVAGVSCEARFRSSMPRCCRPFICQSSSCCLG
jgi:cytochrome bd-type quinol oxidase subunit 2